MCGYFSWTQREDERGKDDDGLTKIRQEVQRIVWCSKKSLTYLATTVLPIIKSRFNIETIININATIININAPLTS